MRLNILVSLKLQSHWSLIQHTSELLKAVRGYTHGAICDSSWKPDERKEEGGPFHQPSNWFWHSYLKYSMNVKWEMRQASNTLSDVIMHHIFI